MKVALTAVSFMLVCGLTFATPSAQQGTPPTNPPGQPGQGPAPGRPQPPQPGQGTSPGQPGSQTQSDREITLTGCLARDTSASASAGQGANTFLLTRARSAGAGAITSPGATGRDQGQSGASLNVGQAYRLMAKGKVSLQEHLNHQVRVTGTVVEGATAGGSAVERPQPGSSNPGWSSAGSQNPGSPSADTDARMGAATGQTPTLHVTELTMVSATCETR